VLVVFVILILSLLQCINGLVAPANLQQFIVLVITLIGLANAAPVSVELKPESADVRGSMTSEDCWPPVEDSFIEYAISAFAEKRSSAKLSGYLAVLWVLQLRSLCGLRGVKPYELFHKSELNKDLLEQIPPDLAGKMSDNAHASHVGGRLGALAGATDSLVEVRYEFILQCLRRVEVTDCAPIVYRLAGPEGWNMDPSHLRLAHITALLDHGGMDDQAEELVSQVRVQVELYSFSIILTFSGQ
jgi:hypothetical protein